MKGTPTQGGIMRTIKENYGFNGCSLDKRDIQILCQLDLNCRNSFGGIGKRIGKGKEFVKYRVEGLMDRQVIDSFITMIDYSKLGMYRICLYVKFKEASDELKQKIHDYREKRGCRIKFFSVGAYDLFVDWIIGRDENADSIVHGFMSVFEDEVQEVSLNVLYKIKHYRNRYLYGRQISEPFMSEYINPERVQISSDEASIMSLLQKSPRAKIIDLAESLSLSSKTVVSKLNRLKKLGIIKGFCIKLNNARVGMEDYIILLRLNSKTERIKSKIEAYLDSRNEVSYMGRMLGEYDIEFAVTVKSQEEFIRVLERMRSELKREIRSLEVLFLTPEI